jgi:PAS domain S-box-containing protein
MNLFYGFLIHSFEDRTKRMRKELQEVEESEQRYRQIVESAHGAVAVLDETNRIKWFNGQLLQLTQCAPEELAGRELTKLMEGIGDEAIQELMKGSASGEKLNIREVDVFRKNGERRRAEVSAARFSLSDHKAHTIFYLKDITDREEMEDGSSDPRS